LALALCELVITLDTRALEADLEGVGIDAMMATLGVLSA